jgi:hypothetical protein
MTRKILIPAILFATLMLPACTKNRIWQSVPAQQTINSKSYAIDFEPLKKDTDFFNWFRLTVRNKTGRDMEIDWNRTRYIHNGKESGPFVFAGIVPESVKTATIPGALIPAGGTFTRDIVPFKLIAFIPLREQNIDTENNNIVAGLIPEGENGIFLVIRQNGKSARARVTVSIESREAD